jgi:dTDP-glucose 4,6-dehydratase
MALSKLRVAITGGAGFIGSNAVRHMLSCGYEVLNLDKLTYAGNLNSLSDVSDLPDYHFSKIDICHYESVLNAIIEFRPDAVMHLAAESHVDRSIDGPRQFVETNVLGTFNMLQASLKYWQALSSEQQASFRFLHVSTDEVYGSLGETGLFTESTPYSPHSPYSASKASSDHLARAWCDTYGLPVMVSNCSNNYGPFQFPEKLIPVVILKCLSGAPIPVYGEGKNVRDWLYVQDHCEALQCILERGAIGSTYNIGGNNELKNIDLVHMLCDILDRVQPKVDGSSYRQQITFVRDRPGHDLRYAIDASKIKHELNWAPKQDKDSGFEKTIRWYLNNQSWWEQIVNGDYRLDRQGLASSKGT